MKFEKVYLKQELFHANENHELLDCSRFTLMMKFRQRETIIWQSTEKKYTEDFLEKMKQIHLGTPEGFAYLKSDNQTLREYAELRFLAFHLERPYLDYKLDDFNLNIYTKNNRTIRIKRFRNSDFDLKATLNQDSLNKIINICQSSSEALLNLKNPNKLINEIAFIKINEFPKTNIDTSRLCFLDFSMTFSEKEIKIVNELL